MVPGTALASVPVATPSLPVLNPGWVRVLPLPEAWSATVAPGTGSPPPSRTVTVMVATPVPA